MTTGSETQGSQGTAETQRDGIAIWRRRAGGVMAIAGGVTGLITILVGLTGLSSLVSYVVVFLVACLYGFGVWVGIELLENAPGAFARFERYLWVQIPILQTSVVSYFFASLASFSLIYRDGFEIEYVMAPTGGWAFTLLTPQRQFGVGLNVLPVLLLIVFRLPHWQRRHSS